MTVHSSFNSMPPAPGSSRGDVKPTCCAKCMRGTKAVPGDCGYDLNCPNRCHTKGTR